MLNPVLKLILFALCLSLFPLRGVDKEQALPHSKDAPPSWVKSYDFPLVAVPVKPSQVNLQYLLIDTQRNWEEKTFYRHHAIKMLTQGGVEKISQLKIDFDPSYEHVVMHTIRVYREGHWLDRLEKARCNLIQRETELEENLYNGDFTLVYFLEDIRVGDIVEYSYSLKGSHPLLSSHYTDRVYLQRDYAVERISHRLLGDPHLSFLIKPINTPIEPKICDISPSLHEWSWEASETSPYSYETCQPVWHNPPACIEMSQYRTWEEVAKQFYPFFTLPSDFVHSAPLEMHALVEQWQALTKERAERALLALRFVQEEVRYLGIEEGIGGFKPTDPCVTFQRRFGDCKDKTFLLHTLLHLMDIPSTPLLVHSNQGKRLPEVLPTHYMFNHVVLQIEVEGITYCVDPTSTLQGGSLKTNFFPDYEWGLLLSKDSKELIPLPKVVFKNPTEIDTSFILESEDIACLKIKNTFYDSRADAMRRTLAWSGLKTIEDESLARLQEVYGAVTLETPMQVLDDRENNRLILTESYRVPTQTLSDRKVLEVLSYTLRYYLESCINPERTAPYEIPYPLWVKERVHIESPFMNWQFFKENYAPKHASILFTLSTQIEKNCADYNFELKHLQDHIPLHSLREYWTLLKDIDHNAPGRLSIAPAADPPQQLKPLTIYSVIGLALWLLLRLISRKKRATQELLRFYIDKCRKFHCAITFLTIAFIGGGHVILACSFATTVIVATALYNFIAVKRSANTILFLQCTLWLQGGLSALYLLFVESRILPGEEVTALFVCLLYFGYSLSTMHKARSLLLEETNALASAG